MLSDHPEVDTFEISIFGPGKGESIAVHLGSRNWIIVDSCIDQADKTVPVLDYLRRIGVEVESEVHMVLGTHAHDDHIAGIATVLDVCKSAFFACSSAVTCEEFFARIMLDEKIEKQTRTGVLSEYRKVFSVAAARGKSNRGFVTLKRAVENLPLFSATVLGEHKASVLALSPSHFAAGRAMDAIAASLPRVGDARKLGSADPNEFAVALWIEVADKAVLLGADLLKGPVGCGWSAVLDSFFPDVRASVIKVPHHGAPNAHLDEVWSRLLEPAPVALLAPYRAGVTPRPSGADRERILALTSNAYITASPEKIPRSKTVKNTSAIIGQLAKNVRDPWGKSGHVRARSQIGSADWSVDFTPPGRALTA